MTRATRLVMGCWLGLASCDPAAPTGTFWRPWYDAPDAAVPLEDLKDPTDPPDPPADLSGIADARSPGSMDSGTPDLSPLPGNCSLAVTVTTVTPGGRYSPRNIGAIWINDASDHYVKTLAIWADKRVRYLVKWNAATAAAKVPADRTDAISGATKTSHGVRTGTWNCTNSAKMQVADGGYKVCFELTDFDGQGPYDCVPFTKGPTPVLLTPADVSSFTARKLELVP